MICDHGCDERAADTLPRLQIAPVKPYAAPATRGQHKKNQNAQWCAECTLRAPARRTVRLSRQWGVPSAASPRGRRVRSESDLCAGARAACQVARPDVQHDVPRWCSSSALPRPVWVVTTQCVGLCAKKKHTPSHLMHHIRDIDMRISIAAFAIGLRVKGQPPCAARCTAATWPTPLQVVPDG